MVESTFVPDLRGIPNLTDEALLKYKEAVEKVRIDLQPGIVIHPDWEMARRAKIPQLSDDD